MAEVETQVPAASNTPSGGAANQSPAKKEKKTKNPRTKPTHPPTSEMVNSAIKGLKERGGSSLQAIKKYISANYKVDAEKMAPFIKKYLKNGVVTGGLVQTKGKGASGSFKMASATLKKPPTKASVGASEKKKKPVSTAVKKDKIKKKTTPKKRATAQKTTAPSATVAPSTPVKSPAKKPAKAARKAAATPASDVEKKTPVTPKSKKQTAAESKKKAASPAKVAAVAAVTKTKSPIKAKKASKAGPTKKPKTPKPKTTKAAASPKARKAASPKKKK